MEPLDLYQHFQYAKPSCMLSQDLTRKYIPLVYSYTLFKDFL